MTLWTILTKLAAGQSDVTASELSHHQANIVYMGPIPAQF